MKSIKRTPTHSTHAKARLMMSVRMALFGASLLPMGALAQSNEAVQSTQNNQETASQPSKSLERLASSYTPLGLVQGGQAAVKRNGECMVLVHKNTRPILGRI